jgi:hypothetical protein
VRPFPIDNISPRGHCLFLAIPGYCTSILEIAAFRVMILILAASLPFYLHYQAAAHINFIAFEAYFKPQYHIGGHFAKMASEHAFILIISYQPTNASHRNITAQISPRL